MKHRTTAASAYNCQLAWAGFKTGRSVPTVIPNYDGEDSLGFSYCPSKVIYDVLVSADEFVAWLPQQDRGEARAFLRRVGVTGLDVEGTATDSLHVAATSVGGPHS